MGIRHIFAGLVTAAVMAGAASAATMTVTGVTGTWQSPTPTDVVGLSGVGTSTLSWGLPERSGGPQSAYGFQQLAAGDDIDTDQVFDLGQFTHFNNPILTPARGSTSIATAQLSVTVSVQFEDGVTREITSTFDFAHLETPNQPRTCANGARNGRGVNVNGCADRVQATRNDAQSTTIEVNGVTYELDITGFLFGGQLLEDFWTVERRSNSAVLQAVLRAVDGGEPPPPPAPIPLPAAGWLLLGSMGGLALVRRKRKA